MEPYLNLKAQMVIEIMPEEVYLNHLSRQNQIQEGRVLVNGAHSLI